MNRLKQIPPFPTRFVFDYSVRKKTPAAPGASRNLAIALPVTRLFIYDFIDADSRDRCDCRAVKNHLILVKVRVQLC